MSANTEMSTARFAQAATWATGPGSRLSTNSIAMWSPLFSAAPAPIITAYVRQ